MNHFTLLVATLATLFLAAPSFAGSDCNGTHNCNTDNSVGPITDNFSPSATAAGGDARGGDASARSNSDASALGLGVADAGVFDSGNSSSSVGPVGNNSGNSSSDSSASAFGAQGQMQGQLGILDNENDLDNSTSVSTSTSTSTSTSNTGKNKQDQTAVGSVDSHDSLTVEGDDIVYEAPDIPVNSAAPVFAGACSQGVSVQTQSFGGSAGTTNPVCDYVAVAGGFIAAGERGAALEVLEKAEGAADWRYRFSQIRSVLTLGLL